MSKASNPKRPRLVNLLDDFAFGGVSRGLGIFDSAPVRAEVDPSVQAVNPRSVLAPRLDADVIVLHFPPNWRRLAFLATLRLRNPRAHVVHIEHSYTRAWESLKVRHPARFRAMLAIATRLVDQVVCVSHGQADWLAEAARLDRARIEVISPYAENPGLDALPLPVFALRPVLRVGAFGRFSEQKGFGRLITAFRDGLMPGCELIIGGFGPDEDDLRRLAGDTPGIRFVGRVECVADFLRDCDVVAVPSVFEAYGQVANEAREAGRPILVAPVDGLPEQVGEAGLVVDFDDPHAIAAAFAGLDSPRLTAMSIAARKSTREAGLGRQRQWARLLSRLTGQRLARGRLAIGQSEPAEPNAHLVA